VTLYSILAQVTVAMFIVLDVWIFMMAGQF